MCVCAAVRFSRELPLTSLIVTIMEDEQYKGGSGFSNRSKSKSNRGGAGEAKLWQYFVVAKSCLFGFRHSKVTKMCPERRGSLGISIAGDFRA